MSQNIDTRTAVPPEMTRLDAATMSRKPTPASASPMENFAGLDRSLPRRPSATQIAPSTGANEITNREFTDCSQVVGISQPKIVRSVKSRANRLSEVGACSNADQNTTEKTNSTSTTAIPFFSSPVRPAKRKRYAKYNAASERMMLVIICATACG